MSLIKNLICIFIEIDNFNTFKVSIDKLRKECFYKKFIDNFFNLSVPLKLKGHLDLKEGNASLKRSD
jgi:hypothetical protein